VFGISLELGDWDLVFGTASNGVLPREIVNGSFGGASRFQNSPFQPVNFSWAKPFSSASARPEVCEPNWRMADVAENLLVSHRKRSILARR